MNTASHYLEQFPPIVKANFLLEFKKSRGREFKDSYFSNMHYPSADDMLIRAFKWWGSLKGFKYWNNIYDCLISTGYVIDPIVDPSLN